MERLLFSSLLLAACAQPPAPSSPEPAREERSSASTAPRSSGEAAEPKESADGRATSARPANVVPSAKCAKNLDCVLSTFSQCCACCPGIPHAYSKAQLEALETGCTVRCPSCDAECGPSVDITTYVAQCVDTRCVALPQ